MAAADAVIRMSNNYENGDEQEPENYVTPFVEPVIGYSGDWP